MKKKTIIILLTILILSATFFSACIPEEEQELPKSEVTVFYNGYFDKFNRQQEFFWIQDGTSQTINITMVPKDRSGYVFIGWSLAEDGTEIITSLVLTSGSMRGDEYNLYAVFEMDTTTIATGNFSYFFDIDTRITTKASGATGLTYSASATVTPKDGVVLPDGITAVTIRVNFELQFNVAYQSSVLEFDIFEEDNFSRTFAKDLFTVSNQYNNTNHYYYVTVVSVI